MKEEYIDKVKKQILKGGFPTELEIEKIFVEQNWDVSHNTYFLDKDENKSREIDLKGQYTLQEYFEKDYTEFSLQFVAEIKKEKNKPWVIFTTNTTPYEKKMANFHTNQVHNLDKGLTTKTFHDFGEEVPNRIGRSFTEGFSNGKDKIYSSLCNSIKAFTNIYENTRRDGSSDKILKHIEPLVILNGDLLECFIDNDQELMVVPQKMIKFRFNYISEYYNKDNKGFLITIITKEYLKEYLKIRTDQFQEIFEKLNFSNNYNLK